MFDVILLFFLALLPIFALAVQRKIDTLYEKEKKEHLEEFEKYENIEVVETKEKREECEREETYNKIMDCFQSTFPSEHKTNIRVEDVGFASESEPLMTCLVQHLTSTHVEQREKTMSQLCNRLNAIVNCNPPPSPGSIACAKHVEEEVLMALEQVEASQYFQEVTDIASLKKAAKAVEHKRKRIRLMTVTFADLPEEIWLYSFQFLNVRDLNRVLSVCKLWNTWLSDDQASFVWEGICKSLCAEMIVEKSIDQSEFSVERWKKLSRFLFEYNRYKLTKHDEGKDYETNETPFERTLIAEAIRASSVDYEEQSLKETRIMYSINRTFWSSTGSETTDADEFGIFSLTNPGYVMEREHIFKKTENSDNIEIPSQGLGVLVIDDLILKCFSASWQNYNIYSPQKVKISIGFNESQLNLYQSATIPVEHSADIQNFNIGPVVLITNYNRATLIDKYAQTQEEVNPHPQEDENQEEEGLRRIEITNEELVDALYRFGGRMNEEFITYIHQQATARVLQEETVKEQNAKLKQITLPKQSDLIVKMDFIGKVMTQPTDDLYYTCMEMIDLTGTATII
jgi:hypothetical protein